MSRAVRIGRWCLAHAWLLLVVLGAGLVILWDRRKPPAEVLAAVARERKAIQASARAQELEAELGAERAREAVEQEHRATVEALDAEQKAQAESLRGNPRKLASFLVRAGKR